MASFPGGLVVTKSWYDKDGSMHTRSRGGLNRVPAPRGAPHITSARLSVVWQGSDRSRGGLYRVPRRERRRKTLSRPDAVEGVHGKIVDGTSGRWEKRAPQAEKKKKTCPAMSGNVQGAGVYNVRWNQ